MNAMHICAYDKTTSQSDNHQRAGWAAVGLATAPSPTAPVYSD